MGDSDAAGVRVGASGVNLRCKTSWCDLFRLDRALD